jgi:protein-S-isoprenylcysteine O-methyltransferase Ste14
MEIPMGVVYKIIIFVFATIGIVLVSHHALRDTQHHGFYRFFAWETILILFLKNVDDWFVNPFSFRQIISWSFLIVSLVLIYQGVQLFRRRGNIDQGRNDPALVGIEKTTELVTTRIYRYIRHPFYSSLLFLCWGIFLKNINWIGIILAVITTVFLVITARKEENENLKYFGEKYQEYMQQTKRFVPYLF